MLTAEQVQFFRTFGYLVSDSIIDQELSSELRAELSGALNLAFGSNPEEHLNSYLERRGGPRRGSVLGQYLPVMSERTPISFELAQDERLTATACALLSCPRVIAKPAKAVRYITPSFWHQDADAGPSAVKFIQYVDVEDPIAFSLVPCSQMPAVGAVVKRSLSVEPGPPAPPKEVALPAHSEVLSPGKTLIFDVHLWHCSTSTSQRLQWSVTYLTEPRSSAEVDAAAASLGSFFGKHPSYDTALFPFLPRSWIDGSSRAPLAAALFESGVSGALVDRYAAYL